MSLQAIRQSEHTDEPKAALTVLNHESFPRDLITDISHCSSTTQFRTDERAQRLTPATRAAV